MKNLASVICLTAGAALAGPAHAAVNLIVNGDFSTPFYNGGWGENPVPGWTNLTDTGVEVGNSPNNYGLPCISSNCQNLEVNANTFGTVVQTVTGLTAGDQYILSWYYGGRPGGGPQQLDVSFGGSPIAMDTGSIGSWTYNSVQITATSSSEALQFASVNTADIGGLPSYGNEVDNVSLVLAPGPLPGAGPAGLAALVLAGAAIKARGLRSR